MTVCNGGRLDGKGLNVLVVGGDEALRAGLRLFLEAEDDRGLVSEAEDGSQMLRIVGQSSPDLVVVLADNGPEGSTPELLRLLKVRLPHARVLILSGLDDPEQVAACLAAGANGYLTRPFTRDGFLEAVHLVCCGGIHLEPGAARKFRQWLGEMVEEKREREGISESLTPREQEVFWLVARGHTNCQAAQQLGITDETVKSHLRHIFQKLGLCNRAELIALAARRGRLPPEGRGGGEED